MIHGIFNLPRMHWAYFAIFKKRKCLLICETANYITRQFGESLLHVLAEHLDQPAMAHWNVLVLREKAGVPAPSYCPSSSTVYTERCTRYNN